MWFEYRTNIVPTYAHYMAMISLSHDLSPGINDSNNAMETSHDQHAMCVAETLECH